MYTLGMILMYTKDIAQYLWPVLLPAMVIMAWVGYQVKSEGALYAFVAVTVIVVEVCFHMSGPAQMVIKNAGAPVVIMLILFVSYVLGSVLRNDWS